MNCMHPSSEELHTVVGRPSELPAGSRLLLELLPLSLQPISRCFALPSNAIRRGRLLSTVTSPYLPSVESEQRYLPTSLHNA
jgi:hypothetical protein